MGWGLLRNMWTGIDRAAGEKNLTNEWQGLSRLGEGDAATGRGLTEEGLSGLRGLRGQYQDQLKDPLGEVGRGIFARARGNLSDDFVRTVNAGAARRAQLAAQSGGSLTPEQIAVLDSQDRRNANEGLFQGENQLAITEGQMTLDQTNRLYDRMEGVDRTITGVGQDSQTRGLQTILAALEGRTGKVRSMVSGVLGPWAGGMK